MIHVAVDQHPRADTSREMLARLKPLFGPDGTVIAGNASGIIQMTLPYTSSAWGNPLQSAKTLSHKNYLRFRAPVHLPF